MKTQAQIKTISFLKSKSISQNTLARMCGLTGADISRFLNKDGYVFPVTKAKALALVVKKLKLQDF